LKTSRVAHRIRLNIARTVGTEEYRQALEEFERDLPQDPAHMFLRVERCVLTKDREKGLAAIDTLERTVKGDALLDVLRAQLYLATQDPTEARTCAVRATEAEPTLDRAWWMAISVTLAQKDHAATATLLTGAEKALGIRIGDLDKTPLYAEFVRSPEYRTWIDSRR
jgi:predicted Zn-dependent protease